MSIVDHFDTCYTWSVQIREKNRQSLLAAWFSRLLLVTANIVIPIYYIITRYFVRNSACCQPQTGSAVVISLTSFPTRINRAWIVIESIMRQSKKPKRVILWLSRDQFKTIKSVPQSLLRLTSRGLELRLCDGDLKSHKKYLYTINEYPHETLITIDDDIVYPTKLIEHLLVFHDKYPNAVICNRALLMKRTTASLSPYNAWSELKDFQGPSNKIFFTSGGGTLFPPGSLHSEVTNCSVFQHVCQYADDVWLNAMVRLNKTPIVKTDYYSALLSLLYVNNSKLSDINLVQTGNDVQLRLVGNYCRKKLGIDPFFHQ